ncbi:hypothetical protein NBRGN_024_00820 [Nocardia brasiliensis NBRC 14402]|uniref:hypothetical protein n=1 Tax=Nocardia brasiliensis TaxID=37326 RepID=UPI0002DCE1FC|nr:hypothetical protein [Nocardia brasiliensis]ASF07139.1 hypothetical protein CEQ30_07025 [Nocardia brasiliensis]GAJ80216.1 hypothetical protein NBRGN_024_00820 [Nocardia brasiliensis NBRC 14402]SUB47594.1 Uncharacterised protein [Nocardia brasiliensis]
MNSNNPFARLPEAAAFTVTSTTVTDGDAWSPEQFSAVVPGGKDVSPHPTPAYPGFTIAGHILGRAVSTATAETVAA